MYGELLDVALLNGLTGREHSRSRSIHWVVDLSTDGKPLSFSPTVTLEEKRGKRFQAPKNYHMQFKDGKLQSVCTNQNNWLPDFLVYPVDEVFPGGVDGKMPLTFSKRRETWKLICAAAGDLPQNRVIQGINKFLFSRPRFTDIFRLYDASEDSAPILKLLKEGKENVSFRVGGVIATSDQELLHWWQAHLLSQRSDVIVHLPIGGDLLGEEHGPLAEFFPSVLGGTPMISYNKAPFQSFGLGNQTTPMLLENAEKCAAALNALCNDPDSNLWLGGMQAVFWAANSEYCLAPGFGGLIEAKDPMAVKDFLEAPWGATSKDLPNALFYSVILKKTKGRFSVRYWHTTTLANAQKNVRRWFSILGAGPNHFDSQSIPCKISDLAKCTVQKSKNSRPLPSTYSELFEAALFGRPLPSRLFAAALQRQALELAKGCDNKPGNDFEGRLRARTALIKLYFELNKKGEQVTMENHNCQEDGAYLCGRLLALLDKIHEDAHSIMIEKDGKQVKVRGTNSSPANRAYAAASTTPALVFPQLCKMTRYHLDKIGGGWAHCLEHGYETESGEFVEGLKQVVARLQKAAGCSFPRTLSLEQQGRFAIGFYYERCRQWPKSKKTDFADGKRLSEEANSSTAE